MSTLKELLLLEQSLSSDVTKKASRTALAIKKALKPYMLHGEKLEVQPLAENKAAFTIDFNRWIRSENLSEIWDEMRLAIESADLEGHLHKVEIGNGSGDEYAEALLQGLRPGMKVDAAAFFPTIEYIVTWKMIIKRR